MNSLHIFIAIQAHKGLAAYALGSSIVESDADVSKVKVNISEAHAFRRLHIECKLVESAVGHMQPTESDLSTVGSILKIIDSRRDTAEMLCSSGPSSRPSRSRRQSASA